MIMKLIQIFLCIFLVSNLYAAQSTITESEGYACMGEDKSRKQTEQAAMADAKRKAVEQVSSYITSETQVKDFELQKDLVEAYSRAAVKVIQEIEKGWYKDQSLGDCFKIKIKAEVMPDEKAMERVLESKHATDNPSAPLHVQVWTDREEYKMGDKIKIYLKGNKPFYGVILYRDAKGEILQLLPNPYRRENYFNGGTTYLIPSGDDRFELEVNPPFGEEEIIIYASTTKPGELNLEETGAVYRVRTRGVEIGDRTRGVVIKPKATGVEAEEFFEVKKGIKTGGKR